MSRRKPHNHQARSQAYLGALLRQNHVAVVDAEASEVQVLVNWQNGKRISLKQPRVYRLLVEAVCEVAHHWSVYLAALCCDQFGQRYMKSAEVEPEGVFLAKSLDAVIEHYAEELKANCNPAHFVGIGWIAIPDAVTLEEAQAAAIFESVGAWQQQQAA